MYKHRFTIKNTHPHTHIYILHTVWSILTDITKLQEKRLNKIINQICKLIFNYLKEHTPQNTEKTKLAYI